MDRLDQANLRLHEPVWGAPRDCGCGGGAVTSEERTVRN